MDGTINYIFCQAVAVRFGGVALRTIIIGLDLLTLYILTLGYFWLPHVAR